MNSEVRPYTKNSNYSIRQYHCQGYNYVILLTYNLEGFSLELLSTVCRDTAATITKFAAVDTLFSPVDSLATQKNTIAPLNFM